MAPPRKPHGTEASYRRGCKCAECHAAGVELRERQRADPDFVARNKEYQRRYRESAKGAESRERRNTKRRKANPYQNGRGPAPTSVAAKVKLNSIRDGKCIVWTGSCDADGYGKIWVNGASARTHRALWEETYGPIPDGLLVLHRCDNRPCVRLSHLYLGTHADNTRDKMTRGRWRGGRPKRGSA